MIKLGNILVRLLIKGNECSAFEFIGSQIDVVTVNKMMEDKFILYNEAWGWFLCERLNATSFLIFVALSEKMDELQEINNIWFNAKKCPKNLPMFEVDWL